MKSNRKGGIVKQYFERFNNSILRTNIEKLNDKQLICKVLGISREEYKILKG